MGSPPIIDKGMKHRMHKTESVNINAIHKVSHVSNFLITEEHKNQSTSTMWLGNSYASPPKARDKSDAVSRVSGRPVRAFGSSAVLRRL